MPDDDLESVARVARRSAHGLESADLTAFSDLLDPNVRWGPPGYASPVRPDRSSTGRRRTELRRSVVCPGSTGSKMSCCSPRNVIVVNRERAPLAACSGVTLRDLIERKGEGS